MKKKLVFMTLLLSFLMNAQNPYTETMERAFALWEANQPEQATALFNQLAQSEKDSWFPGYYAALVPTTTTFYLKDIQQVNRLLTEAQQSLDEVLKNHKINAELLVLQALIHTAWVAHDPMNNAMKLTPQIHALYAQALQMEPENPRVVCSRIQFDLESAPYMGGDISIICDQLKQSIVLFDKFKVQVPFYPSWGKEHFQQVIAQSCQK